MSGAQTRVGALVLGALVILGATIFLLGRQEHLWERKVAYPLRFARTNGLQRGAPVSLSGLPIGSVDSLHFSPEGGPDYIEVWVRVDADAASRIRSDTTASIRTLGLLGDKYIELVPGSTTAEPIPPGGLIPSVDPVDYEALFGRSGGDIVTNVVEVTTALKDVLQTIQRGEGLLGAMIRNREFGETTLRDLQRTLGNVRGTSQRLDRILSRVDRGEGVIGRLVGDTKESRTLAASLDRSIQSLARVTDRLEHGRGAAVRLMEDREYGDRLLSKLDRTVTDLGTVADKLERGEGTLGKLVNDPALYDEARGLVHDVRSSWLVRFYEALHGLWPSGGGAPPASAPARTAP
jgi:phospholipid/cholesterol/gamma-HCH transport system substrate-binding protein